MRINGIPDTPPCRRGALLAGALLLAACGGGGDGDQTGGNGGPLAPLPDPGGAGTLGSYFVSSFAGFEARAAWLRDTVQRYTIQSGTVTGLPDHPLTPGNTGGDRFSYPLASARVDYAHAAGLTGRGQLIAVVDDGFRQTHEVFAGKSNLSVGGPPVDDHGTTVASIAAGNSGGMIGVAPDANLLFGNWTNEALATREALAQGAIVQNNSWGYANAYATLNDFDEVFVNDASGADYLDALTGYAAEYVVVFALNNDPADTATSLTAALPRFVPALETGWIAVGNAIPVFDADDITGAALVSAGCYQAAPWCLMADGYWYGASGASNTAYASGTGSSYASPMVSGAMALLAEAFPVLTPHELRLRLLASADNSFAGFVSAGSVEIAPGFSHDYSDLYGHGFLDLRAALLPIGGVRMSLSDGTKVAPDEMSFGVGAAIGDAVERQLSGIDLGVTDSLGGSFAMPAKALAAGARPRAMSDAMVGRALRTDLTRTRTAQARPANPAFGDHEGETIAFGNTLTGLGATLLVPNGAENYGVEVTRTFRRGGTRLAVGLKTARDEGMLLGLGAEGTEMAALRIGLAHEGAGGAFFSVGAEFGVADIKAPRAIQSVGQVRYDSFGAEVGRRSVFGRGDRLALGVSMPVAVTSGQARIDLPVYDAGTRVASSVPMSIDLSPGARQIDFSLSYQMPAGERSEILLELAHSQNHGNRAGERDSAGLIAVRWEF